MPSIEAIGGNSSPIKGGRYYYVKSGDTPSGIALKELGNANRWREIIRESTGRPLTDADATNLQPGERLILSGGNAGSSSGSNNSGGSNAGSSSSSNNSGGGSSGSIDWNNTSYWHRLKESYFMPLESFTLDDFKSKYEAKRSSEYKSKSKFLYTHLYDYVALEVGALHATGKKNASELLWHFLGNSGEDKEIDVGQAIEDSPWVKKAVNFEGSAKTLIEESKKAVKSMNKTGRIIMGFQGSGSPPWSERAQDWYLALGNFDYSYVADFEWNQNNSGDPRSGVLKVTVKLTVADTYDFDFPYVSEKTLHEAGLAQNFFTWGSKEKTYQIPMQL